MQLMQFDSTASTTASTASLDRFGLGTEAGGANLGLRAWRRPAAVSRCQRSEAEGCDNGRSTRRRPPQQVATPLSRAALQRLIG